MLRNAIVVSVLFAAGALAQQAPMSGFLPADPMQQPGAAGTTNPREESLYRDATTALNNSNWQAAADQFSQVAAMRGRRADAALYWQAYAKNKLGRRQEALNAIAELRKSHPRSNWLNDAAALEMEMRPAGAQKPAQEFPADEELKLLAINSLMNSDAERAVPMLQKVLDSNSSPRLKERALFVLAQSDSPKAQEVIAGIARRQLHPELQLKAIEYLGINDTAASRKAMVEVYNSNNDARVKQAALHAMLVADAKDSVLAIARSEANPDLRREAIHQLGAMDARQELGELYRSAANASDRKQIIEALGISGDVTTLSQVARSERDPEVKKAAIHALGIADAKGARETLLQMYTADPDKSVRQAVVEALFISDDAHDLIDLFRREGDPEMRRHIAEKLAVMDSKESREFMLEILNK